MFGLLAVITTEFGVIDILTQLQNSLEFANSPATSIGNMGVILGRVD
ncbi:hypothetical protein H3Z85_19025 [Chryseobacterium indologenes]|nr:hypothetical protein [Chryseobacterium indologenes]MBF6644536.1 hypothetical protein [Chryseobacterium indologenes]MEB4759529.1 hypothetical protein [Chryseobacterium indologenes]QPQ51367.1 hypothetical protein H3Z85_19025 [Chryseobacterium indologenes]QQQ71765.1 hypothetical protein JHW31_03275 [Chryseobacterium indologenes]